MKRSFAIPCTPAARIAACSVSFMGKWGIEMPEGSCEVVADPAEDEPCGFLLFDGVRSSAS
ncbi:MAG: hypothetical protein ACYDEZ_08865, partial [Methanoregula sp.]